jgi:hypothetical protein
MQKDMSGPDNHPHYQKDQIQKMFHVIAYFQNFLSPYTTSDHKCAYLKPPGQKMKQSESGLFQKVPNKWDDE